MRRRLSRSRTIDGILKAHLGSTRDISVLSRRLPFYKFLDVARATEALATANPGWQRVESQHPEVLSAILAGAFDGPGNRRLQTPTRIPRPNGISTRTYVPQDCFWLLPPSDPVLPLSVVRLQRAYHTAIALEVATRDTDRAARLIDQIVERAGSHSVFKGHILELLFNKDDRMLDVLFRSGLLVHDDDFILSDHARRILDRTIIDFHTRRPLLEKLGIPARRGVLFYGPPGTGKSYTCRYLASQLDSVTTLTASGLALKHVRQICALARDLQPALVVLEDVDLLFSQRDSSPCSAVLGDLMDELDGFAVNDRVLFILTTNFLERVEQAIRDRPGRISQCIHFPPPDPELRRRLLRSLLARHDGSRLDVDRIVRLTEGVTQAFLKELVYRSVQIATREAAEDVESAVVETQDVELALTEMRETGGVSGEHILGFRSAPGAS